jgi:hypothetical protein
VLQLNPSQHTTNRFHASSTNMASNIQASGPSMTVLVAGGAGCAGGIERPTIQDYKALHSMVCSPSQARRCLNSFNGAILFADCSVFNKPDVSAKDLDLVDYNHSVVPLNVVTYYLFVIVSFSGICTLLGYTQMTHSLENRKFTKASCRNEGGTTATFVQSNRHPELRVPYSTIDYLLDLSAKKVYSMGTPSMSSSSSSSSSPTRLPPRPELYLTQRFEFEFGSLYQVMMLHFESSDGRQKHLLEIYKFHSPILGTLVNSLIWSMNQILYWFRPILNEKRD